VDARLIPALWNSSKVTLRVLWRVTRQFFHEAMGTMFALFAVYGGLAAFRQWKNRPALWLVCFAIAYALMMATFAFISFHRARRIR
jgi:glycerol uptake facilitator-like aquaporin